MDLSWDQKTAAISVESVYNMSDEIYSSLISKKNFLTWSIFVDELIFLSFLKCSGGERLRHRSLVCAHFALIQVSGFWHNKSSKRFVSTQLKSTQNAAGIGPFSQPYKAYQAKYQLSMKKIGSI